MTNTARSEYTANIGLSILQTTDGHRLTEFSNPEHDELLGLRSQTQNYETVIMELKTHLHNVYAVAGGIRMLPLSETAQHVLNIIEAQPTPSDGLDTDGLITPLSLSFGKTRPIATNSSQPHLAPAFAKNVASLGYSDGIMDMVPSSMHNTTMTPMSAKDVYSFQHTAKPVTPTVEDSGARRYSQLEALVVELRQTVDEQQSDIEDLEAMLRERKHLIRTLRKQLRDKELRQFAAASDHAGLRRTASIMGVPKSALAQLAVANQLLSPTSVCDRDIVPMLKPVHLTAIASSDSNRSSAERQDNAASNKDSSSELSFVENARRPSGFVNGWPIYNTDQNAKLEHPTLATNSADEQTVEQEASDRPLTPPTLPFANPKLKTSSTVSSPRSANNALHYKNSVGSELGTSAAETSNSASLASRTPRSFRTIVARTPRRIYSRLSNRLKKPDL
ncbi:hypothetical protein EV181_000284 [Coemansia sp. RSA 532]|nr:hypothetical protein EV181_000284 [Coemansia sp. RSA 532]KAJ2292941.1 hypothetical protein IW141_001545 [Coemansia sp. RSA 355]KAJ2438145.1 hypothetical protein IWW46_005027 [Coemansia sp. RSA 2440]